MQHLYSYDGPVMKFDTCIESHFKSETVAASEKKARANLTYQYKQKLGVLPSCKITLPGKIKQID